MTGKRNTHGQGGGAPGAGGTILCGTELHVRFGETHGMQGMIIDWVPACGPDGLPAGDEIANNTVAGICREQLLYSMEAGARDRLIGLAEKDGGRDRMLYRLVVSAREPGENFDPPCITDQIDPTFAAIDTGLAQRAGACRAEIGHILAGDYLTEDQRAEKTFEVLESPEFPPAIPDRTEEESRRALLAGEECLLLELQVIGVIDRKQGRESFGLDCVAAMSQKALSSPWMQEKAGSLSDVCANTVMGISPQTTRRLGAAIAKSGTGKTCLYRLSVMIAMNEDGSPRYAIRDTVDPLFPELDSAIGHRAAEARRLAAKVMEEGG
jgi:hypothetical protein